MQKHIDATSNAQCAPEIPDEDVSSAVAKTLEPHWNL